MVSHDSWPGIPPEVPPPPRPGEPDEPGGPPAVAPVPLVVPPNQSQGVHGLLPERMVLLLGILDEEAATRAAAQLMTLDAQGEDEIILHLACDRGQLLAALMLAETIELAASPVVAVGRGDVGGVALAPFAAAHRRLAFPHTTFRLSEPEVSLCGDVHTVQARTEELLRHVDRLHTLLAAATGQSKHQVVADMERGLSLDADAARDYGLVDEILSRSG